jgi:hypothetical protein
MYAFMAFAFAASIMVSLWVGLIGIETSKNFAADQAYTAVGRGK